VKKRRVLLCPIIFCFGIFKIYSKNSNFFTAFFQRIFRYKKEIKKKGKLISIKKTKN